MAKHILFDGLNLALSQGTGIATYTRELTKAAHKLGYNTGILYSARRRPSKDLALREINFFDERRGSFGGSPISDYLDSLLDLMSSFTDNRPVPLPRKNVVDDREFAGKLPEVDQNFVSTNVFHRAHTRFEITGGFLTLAFDKAPDIVHCTYQLPLRAHRSANIVTIHDLVPLRLPFTTTDSKRKTYRLLHAVARKADHIVTVSESSKRDIMKILSVEETRITNTYQAVSFPDELLARTEESIAEQLAGSLGLEWKGYLLFFGAMEPKKNIARIIEAYHASDVNIPLILVTSQGWDNENEVKLIKEQTLKQRLEGVRLKRHIFRFEFVSRSMLVTLIRGSRAVLFPSLYEGFGLPVLEAMTLGTPVITSQTSSLPEIAGEATLMVDPYDTDALSRAITAITQDNDLRTELSLRGQKQAALFSPSNYEKRLRILYDKLS